MSATIKQVLLNTADHAIFVHWDDGQVGTVSHADADSIERAA